MAVIQPEDWQRMVEAMGPEGAEQWRVQQGIEVGTPQALPDAGAETPMGALQQPMTQEGGGVGQRLLALQRQANKVGEEERDYRRKLFEEGRARLEQQRMGPSRAEQLFALSAAFAQPQRYKGFGGMMANVTPVLADMAAVRGRADTDRATALQKLQEQYMSGDFAARRQSAGDELKMLQIQASLEKPKARRTGISPVDGLLYDLDTGEVIPFKQSGGGGGAAVQVASKEAYDALPPGTQYVAPDGSLRTKAGGPTQSASGGFPR